MSYLTQALLSEDVDFGRRSRSCLFQQAGDFITSDSADEVALSDALLKNEPQQTLSFLQAICASPGFSDTVDNGDGTVDSSKVSDADILASVQALWPRTAALFYTSDGTPR